jgi:hypothetical protein
MIKATKIEEGKKKLINTSIQLSTNKKNIKIIMNTKESN